MSSQASAAWFEPRARWGARGFTFLELLTTSAIVFILSVLSIAAFTEARHVSQNATCANSLRQLGAANNLYLSDHANRMYKYKFDVPTGRFWYFGFETTASLMSAEGHRFVDVTQSPIYPYVNTVGGVEICPSFPYGLSMWKPKYVGASWGYGFNAALSDQNVFSNMTGQPVGPGQVSFGNPAGIILFADCAQVNCFQAPASANHPMIEEFYMLDAQDATFHFRHAGHANVLFLDGHVEKFTMFPGTLDSRLTAANCGRITKPGDLTYLTHAPTQ